jgi:hypothetical protein
MNSLRPIIFQPKRNRGMFKSHDTVPTGAQGRKKLMIWAIPVTPPETMSFGYVKNRKPAAATVAPTMIFSQFKKE